MFTLNQQAKYYDGVGIVEGIVRKLETKTHKKGMVSSVMKIEPTDNPQSVYYLTVYSGIGRIANNEFSTGVHAGVKLGGTSDDPRFYEEDQEDAFFAPIRVGDKIRMEIERLKATNFCRRDHDGVIKSIVLLDRALYNKPEGWPKSYKVRVGEIKEFFGDQLNFLTDENYHELDEAGKTVLKRLGLLVEPSCGTILWNPLVLHPTKESGKEKACFDSVALFKLPDVLAAKLEAANSVALTEQ